jgi:hypothetical protein
MEAVQGRVLLVGIQVRGEHEVLEPVRMLVDYPPARFVHRLRHHVLSGGVTGCEVEAEPAHPAQRVLLDVAKLAGSGRLFRLGLDGGEALVNPAAEVACGPSVAKHEHGCPPPRPPQARCSAPPRTLLRTRKRTKREPGRTRRTTPILWSIHQSIGTFTTTTTTARTASRSSLNTGKLEPAASRCAGAASPPSDIRAEECRLAMGTCRKPLVDASHRPAAWL